MVSASIKSKSANVDKPVPLLPKDEKKDSQIPIPGGGIGFYKVPLFCLLLDIILAVGAIVMTGLMQASPVAIILDVMIAMVATPIFLIGFLFGSIKIYLDRKKISTKIINKISQNYIMADVFLENRRMETLAYLLEPDGHTFYRKGGIYGVDRECIWFDDKRRPHSYYIDGVPNPLKFGFEGGLKEFMAQVRDAALDDIKDKEGGITPETYIQLDLMFSATSLAEMKKSKFMAEMFNPGQEDMSAKYLLVAIIIFAILLLLLAYLMRPHDTNIVVTGTQALNATAKTVVVGR